MVPTSPAHQPHNNQLGASQFWRAAYRSARCLRQSDDSAEEVFWRVNACGYDQLSPLAECAFDLVYDLRKLINGHKHLVEIGAGSGAFTKRLANDVSRITVIEPSHAMRTEFERLWEGPKIVETLTCKWENAPVIEGDVVFGANAFYRIDDIASAISKMNRCARYRVALVQSFGRPHAEPLLATVNGVTYEKQRADALCDVLAELGIKYLRRNYDIMRPSGLSHAALIDWAPSLFGAK